MKIAITGATGYIGRQLAALALHQEHHPLLLTRTAPAADAGAWLRYDLFDTDALTLPGDVQAVVHLAFNPRVATEADGDAEMVAALRLLDAAAAVGARFVFVSSQTAREDAPTAYGRTKWRIEQLVLQRGGSVVRPGQVYGGAAMGLFGLLVNLVDRLPMLPAFLPAPMIQPVHVDDLALALLRIAQLPDATPEVHLIAQSQALSFTTFLRAIAASHVRKTRFFVPVPTALVRLAVRLLGAERSNRLGLSRLDSLFALPVMDTRGSLALLGLQLRSLESGMQPAAPGDQLAAEAAAMLCYVLNRRPDSDLVERYIAAIGRFREGRALGLPGFALRHPALLALLDDRAFLASERGQELAWRLDAATLLAEATQAGAERFIGIRQPAGMLRYGLGLACAVASEVFWRIARPVSMPLFLRDAINRSFP